jgi:hypothetical protein
MTIRENCLTGSRLTPLLYECTYSAGGQLLMFWNISCRSSWIFLGLGVSNVARVGSWIPLYSHPRCTCFFRGITRHASQWVATQTPVKPWFLWSLTRLARAATIGSSVGVGSSDQVPLNRRSHQRRVGGGRGQVHGFHNKTRTCAIPWAKSSLADARSHCGDAFGGLRCQWPSYYRHWVDTSATNSFWIGKNSKARQRRPHIDAQRRQFEGWS